MSETNYFWDPLSDNILQERDETGAVTAEYTTEPGVYGNLISQNRGGVESKHHFDAVGSTLAMTDDNQQVTDSYAYSAYGEVTEQTGSMVNPFQFIGRKGYYREFAAAEYFIRRRVFRSAQGRWLSGDPKTLGWNYNYVNNRCCLLVDSSGEQVILPRLCVSKLRIVPGPKELGKLDCGKSPFQAWDFVVEFSSEDPKERDTAPCTGFII